MNIHTNIQKSEQLKNEVAVFFAKNNLTAEDVTLPIGFSGYASKGCNNSNLEQNAQTRMKQLMSASVDQARAERRRKNNASREEVLAVKEWCKARTGRSAELSRILGKNPAHISQITGFSKGCTHKKMADIREGMKLVEEMEAKLKAITAKYCGAAA